MSSTLRLAPLNGYWDDAANLVPLPLAYLAVTHGADLSFMPAAVTLGLMAHLVGDAVTHRGIPYGWPLSDFTVGVKVLVTGGLVERFAIFPTAVVYTAAVLTHTALALAPGACPVC
ncbi:hypothetical protein [Microbispora sp. NPDC049125]|uniref:hypothetical protein n=1 Tax=Microbispora sp. NPDC049125 TaxID=3154929 RepID=UPI003467AB81